MEAGVAVAGFPELLGSAGLTALLILALELVKTLARHVGQRIRKITQFQQQSQLREVLNVLAVDLDHLIALSRDAAQHVLSAKLNQCLAHGRLTDLKLMNQLLL